MLPSVRLPPPVLWESAEMVYINQICKQGLYHQGVLKAWVTCGFDTDQWVCWRSGVRREDGNKITIRLHNYTADRVSDEPSVKGWRRKFMSCNFLVLNVKPWQFKCCFHIVKVKSLPSVQNCTTNLKISFVFWTASLCNLTNAKSKDWKTNQIPFTVSKVLPYYSTLFCKVRGMMSETQDPRAGY